jgi:hypothetical protein
MIDSHLIMIDSYIIDQRNHSLIFPHQFLITWQLWEAAMNWNQQCLDRQAWDIYHDLISIPSCNIHLCVKLTNQYITFIFFEMISATTWSVSQTSFSFFVYRKRNQIVGSSISVAFSFPLILWTHSFKINGQVAWISTLERKFVENQRILLI